MIVQTLVHSAQMMPSNTPRAPEGSGTTTTKDEEAEEVEVAAGVGAAVVVVADEAFCPAARSRLSARFQADRRIAEEATHPLRA